jgi:hypothetical protein
MILKVTHQNCNNWGVRNSYGRSQFRTESENCISHRNSFDYKFLARHDSQRKSEQCGPTKLATSLLSLVTAWRPDTWNKHICNKGNIIKFLLKQNESSKVELEMAPKLPRFELQWNKYGWLKLNSVALDRKRTIPTEQPPLVGEVSANFCG